jgi:tRNA(Ile)-lysidine synthase
LLKKGTTVVVGVSGGPDSVALVHVLWKIRYQLGIQILIGHFNHRLRAAASTDQKFVVKLAEKLGLPIECAAAKKFRPSQGSVEDWARQERLNFLTTLAKRHKAPAIVLAHTQDDLAETVLMRILRGSGLSGLRGILMERTIQGVNIIRPFLGVTKRDILNYLKREKLLFRTDHTNFQSHFFRNKIRLKLIPLLKKEYNPNIQQVLSHLAETVTVDYDFIHELGLVHFKQMAKFGKGSIILKVGSVLSLPVALRRGAFRFAYESLKGDLKRLTLDHILAAENLLINLPVSSIVHWPEGVRVVKTKTSLEFRK